MPTLVSAIVLNYRTPRYVLPCVEALKQQCVTLSGDEGRHIAEGDGSSPLTMTPSDLEILVVDNHSQDESIQWIRNRLRADPAVRIFESPENCGYAAGNNIAIRAAKGEYLLVINPDNALAPGALQTMVDVMKADPTIGIIAPKLIHEDGTVRDSVRRFPSPLDVIIKRSPLQKTFQGKLRRYLALDEDPNVTRDVDWAVGACLLIRKDFYEELGGFDERFFLFFEDMDLCRRCWNAGKRVVYLPKAEATDRKKRLSEGGIWHLLTRPSGRAHLGSAVRYFAKWGIHAKT